MTEPNNTLYFKNIDWKVKKLVLERALYTLCTRHGKVLQVIVLRRDGLRGQAWVVMETVEAATMCLQAEQGFNFFGKDMVIEYAKQKTKQVSNKDPKRKDEEPLTKKLRADDPEEE